MKFNLSLIAVSCIALSSFSSAFALPNSVDVFGNKAKESACHKQLYKDCGEPLNKLKDAIEEVSILGIIGSSLDTASCITEHISEIVKACTGQEVVESNGNDMVQVTKKSNNNNDDDDDKEGRCHKALYDICGDELAALRKAIKDTSPNGIVGASLELAGCITIDFVKLVKACSPFKKSAMNLLASESSKEHFDFYDCVQMAKKELQNADQTAIDAPYHEIHPHGPVLFMAVVVLLFAFVKGYMLGSGSKLCCTRSTPQPEDLGKLQYVEVLDNSPTKDSKAVLLA